MPRQEFKMDRVTISIPDRQIDSLDEMINQKIYPSVSEAVRAAVALLEDKHGIHGKPAVTPAPSQMLVAS